MARSAQRPERTWVHIALNLVLALGMVGLPMGAFAGQSALILGGVGLIVAAGLGYTFVESLALRIIRRRARAALAETLGAAGFTRGRRGTWQAPDAQLAVRWLRFDDADPGRMAVQVATRAGRRLPSRVELRTPIGWDPAIRVEAGVERDKPIRLGAPAFDAQFAVTGPEAAIRALLGPAEQAALLAAHNADLPGLSIIDGALVAEALDDERLGDALDAVKALAEALRAVAEAPVVERLRAALSTTEGPEALALARTLLTVDDRPETVEALAERTAAQPWLALLVALKRDPPEAIAAALLRALGAEEAPPTVAAPLAAPAEPGLGVLTLGGGLLDLDTGDAWQLPPSAGLDAIEGAASNAIAGAIDDAMTDDSRDASLDGDDWRTVDAEIGAIERALLAEGAEARSVMRAHPATGHADRLVGAAPEPSHARALVVEAIDRLFSDRTPESTRRLWEALLANGLTQAATLERLLDAHRPGYDAVLLDWFGDPRRCAAFLTVHPRDDVVALIAKADPAIAEPALLAVAEVQMGDVAVHAIEALGRVGGRRALHRLRSGRLGSAISAGFAHRHALEGALRRLERRVEHGRRVKVAEEGGTLALTAPDARAGGLSAPKIGDGALSPTDVEEG